MTCDATLGRFVCVRTSDHHIAYKGCTFVGLDPEATKDHESEDQ